MELNRPTNLKSKEIENRSQRKESIRKEKKITIK